MKLQVSRGSPQNSSETENTMYIEKHKMNYAYINKKYAHIFV